MSAGTAYSKRYGAGFVDLPTQTTPVDQQFLNAVEVALLQLIGQAPTVDGQVAQWDFANTRFGPALLLNKNIDAAAAIAKSKLDFTGANGIVDADVSGVAAIARSKLNFGAGLVNADIAASAAVAASKISGGVGSQLLWDSVDAGVTLPAASITTPALSQAYKHLRVEFTGRDTGATTLTRLGVRLNGDSTAGNYVIEGSESNAGALGRYQLQSSSWVVLAYTGASAAGSLAGSGTIKIFDYTRTTFLQSATFYGGAIYLNVSGDALLGNYVGYWNSLSAVTTLTFLAGSATFAAGTRISVYGEV